MKKIISLLFLLGISSSSQAGSLLYGGASAGYARLNDNSAVSNSFFIGTDAIPYLGFEGGTSQLGSFNIDNSDVSYSTLYAAIKPNIEFGPVQLYVKAGLHSWTAEANSGVISENKDDYDAMWAVGADYTVLGPVALGVEYQSYTVGDKQIGSVNLTATLYMF